MWYDENSRKLRKCAVSCCLFLLPQYDNALNKGKPVTGHSGYCEYPLYEFDDALLRRIDPEGYERHFGNALESEQKVKNESMQMEGIS